MKTARRFFIFIILASMLCQMLSLYSFGEGVEDSLCQDEILAVAQGIIDWKKLDVGSSPDGYLINNNYLQNAGSTVGDWFCIGLGRIGVPDDYNAYLAVIKENVEQRYRSDGGLSPSKATEWHRISLAILACGGDPTKLCLNEDGSFINLIADGTYNRGAKVSLGRQGINGWIWGLIALDSKRYTVPSDAFYSRDDIIVEILSRQLEDGGFALSGKVSDPDITAMAVQALSTYYNDEKMYTYKNRASGSEISLKVRDVIDMAIECLSCMQNENGGFFSWGTENVESVDQVIVALCALGIDPMTDERFIKNGNTLWDAMICFQMNDGGFVHSYSYDPDNPTSLPDKSNTMAGEQTLYTMAALYRQRNFMRNLYDFRDEMSEGLKERLRTLISEIGKIDENTSEQLIEKLLCEFYSLPENERSYVSNYYVLSDIAIRKNIDISSVADATDVIYDNNFDDDSDQIILYFSISDCNEVDKLPEKLTGEYYVSVIKLLSKLENSDDFAKKDEYRKKLLDAKSEIEKIREKVRDLNFDIADKLYPFDSLNLSDKKFIDDIMDRYYSLSEYDRGQVEHIEDVIKSKTKIDNSLRAIYIGISAVSVAVFLAALLIIRIRKRKRRKTAEMEELAKMYEDE